MINFNNKLNEKENILRLRIQVYQRSVNLEPNGKWASQENRISSTKMVNIYGFFSIVCGSIFDSRVEIGLHNTIYSNAY